MKIDATGNIIDIEDVSEMLDKLGFEPESVREATGNQLPPKSQFLSMLNVFGQILPDRPVRVGESWGSGTQEREKDAQGTFTTYTLKSRKNGVSTVEVGGTIFMETQGQTGAQTGQPTGRGRRGMGGGAMNISMKSEGTLKGEIKMDESSGMILESTFEQDVRMKVTSTSRRDPSQTNESEMRNKSSSVITVKKLN